VDFTEAVPWLANHGNRSKWKLTLNNASHIWLQLASHRVMSLRGYMAKSVVVSSAVQGEPKTDCFGELITLRLLMVM